ncbi:MAG: hypothetical protein HC769_32495 [Cyanobacteria bacterium CRU_2_1]|nr:hypothetical protein [Cyanobacteria bacterium CRU_2_1]
MVAIVQKTLTFEEFLNWDDGSDRSFELVNGVNLLSYFRDYQAGGVAKLKELTFNRLQSELKPHQASLAAYFRKPPPKTLAQAAAKIAELTGIVRSREQGRHFFKSIVLGALNAVTHALIIVTNETDIKAQSVCELLNKIAALGLSIPITLVLDNARYQKCAVVMELARSLNIELLYLTAYSPNLNLIERLWKFVKKQCLYSIYYADFNAFKAAIVDNPSKR